MPPPPHRPHSFNELIDSVAALANNGAPSVDDGIRIGSILHVIGHRSFGPVLLLVGLFSISPATILPGMTWFAAALTLLLSLQLIFGSRHPWLPRRLLSVRVARQSLRAGATDGLRTWARRLDRVLKPRLVFLSEPPFANIAGVACLIAAVVTFPLGLIPAAPLAPGLAVTLIGVGLFVRDGLLLLAGFATIAAAVWLTFASFG
jgi:hypothetical protein